MAAIIPLRRPEPDASLVKVARPVTSLTWQQLAGLGNWLLGKGASLVPFCTPGRAVAASASESFRFRVKTRQAAIQRVWVIHVVSASTTVGADITLQAPATGGTARTYTVGALAPPIVYVENLASQSATEQQIEIEVNVDAASSASAVVKSIACWEQDRPILQQNTTDYGIDLYTLSGGQPIADFYLTNESVGGVINALANCDPRRVGIFHWTIGDGTSAATASGTPANLLQLAVPVLGRKLGRSDTTKSVKWSAYAKVTAGTGTITMSTTQSGVSDSASVTSTTYAWTSARTVSISCEDLDSTDGRRTAASPAWDDIQFAISASGGTLTVQSISVWEDS